MNLKDLCTIDIKTHNFNTKDDWGEDIIPKSICEEDNILNTVYISRIVKRIRVVDNFLEANYKSFAEKNKLNC